MNQRKNFLGRALDALIAGRERSAARYIDQYERSYGKLNDKLMKR